MDIPYHSNKKNSGSEEYSGVPLKLVSMSSNYMIPNYLIPNYMIPNYMIPNYMIPNYLIPNHLVSTNEI